MKTLLALLKPGWLTGPHLTMKNVPSVIICGICVRQKVVAAPAPVIDTSDMDPELARYLNRNYWQQKSVELKSSSSATVTQPSAPAIAADTKVSTAGSGLNNSTALQQQNAVHDDEVAVMSCCTH